MKLTIFSTLCLGFSSAALAAIIPEATHQLAERQMRDRLCGRVMSSADVVDVESYDGTDAVEPEANLQARGRNYPGTCDRDSHVCMIKWTEGPRTCRAKCNCKHSTCSTTGGYCTYTESDNDCICT